jgi:hypothetical protein
LMNKRRVIGDDWWCVFPILELCSNLQLCYKPTTSTKQSVEHVKAFLRLFEPFEPVSRYPTFCFTSLQAYCNSTWAKNISVRMEWLRQSGCAPSEPSETPQWQITLRLAIIPRVALHIALQAMFCHFFSLCRSSILNKHSGVVANCDHMSEWVHWVHACIGIAMQWVTLRKSLLVFFLPVRKMQFSLY